MRKKAKKCLSIFLIFVLVSFLCLSQAAKNATLAVQNIYDMANSSNYNLRYDGEEDYDYFSLGIVAVADLNNNGKPDIVTGAPYSNYGHDDAGSVYVIYDNLIDDYSSAGNTIDMSDSSNYNLRFYGAEEDHLLSDWALTVGDFDNDSKQDILVGAIWADYNSRTNSGSFYIIYNTLIDDYSGTGNNIDLGNANNYNLRFDGAVTEESGFEGVSFPALIAADLDNDGKQDILASSVFENNNSRTNSGSFYIIYNTLIDNYSGTGNNIDLASSSNYNLRLDAAMAGDSLSYGITTADLDNDGKQDILVAAVGADNNSRTDSGSFYIIYNTLIDNYSGTGNNIDLANSSNYNLRYDGADSTSSLGYWTAAIVSDLDNDGKQDLLLSDPVVNLNSRTFSGSLYVIKGTLIDNYSGTGNNIDLANSSNYNLRYDGAAAWDMFSFRSLATTDIDYDGKQDILVGAPWADFNSRNNSGSLYAIYNTLIDDYSGTGNNIDMSDSANYTLRYDGEFTSGWFPYTQVIVSDLNNDGREDILIGDNYGHANSRTRSGSLYVLYNFPHSIGPREISSSAGGGPKDISGTITASDSITKIKKVQYSLDDSTPRSSSWTDCSSSDGGFDSRSESFSCDLESLSGSFVEGTHHLYVRAYDTNNSFTSQARYTQTIEVDKTTPEITDLALVNLNTFIQGGKTYQLPETERTLSFSGEAHEDYSSFSQEYPKLASGLDILTIQVSQLNQGEDPLSDNSYTQYLSETYSLTDPLIVSDIRDERDKEKFARFFVTLPHPLPDGYFQVKISLKDKAQNNFDYSPFYLSLNYSLTPTPIPTPPSSSTSKTLEIIEEKKIPVETEEEKERIKEEGVTLQVKVIDNQNNPIPQAKVSLYSQPRTEFTNQEGIATFNNVPQGEHQVVIAYRNYKSEPQPLSLLNEPDIKTYEITVRVEEMGRGFPWGVVILAFLGGIFFLGLILLFRQRQKGKTRSLD